MEQIKQLIFWSDCFWMVVCQTENAPFYSLLSHLHNHSNHLWKRFYDELSHWRKLTWNQKEFALCVLDFSNLYQIEKWGAIKRQDLMSKAVIVKFLFLTRAWLQFLFCKIFMGLNFNLVIMIETLAKNAYLFNCLRCQICKKSSTWAEP